MNEKWVIDASSLIILEIYSDEVIAHLVDAEVTGFGETETEALAHIIFQAADAKLYGST